MSHRLIIIPTKISVYIKGPYWSFMFRFFGKEWFSYRKIYKAVYWKRQLEFDNEIEILEYIKYKQFINEELVTFPGGTIGKEPACHCRRCKRCRFDPWVRKIPWRRAWQPTPVFLPGESHGQGAWRATAHGVAESQPRLCQMSMHQHER